MEFECGDGNYGDNYGQRIDPYTLEHKLKLCIAQGNRLINYYLFTGGRNYVLDPEPLDGNGRIAFTGEHHGFAAPISPAGAENYTYRFLREATLSLKALSKSTGNLSVSHDPLTVAFIQDYFMSEYHYGSRSGEMVSDLQTHRAGNFWDSFLKALLLLGYRYDVKNIQDGEIDPERLLILPCARYLDAAIQRKIADHVEGGGRLVIYGELPLLDMTGRACRELTTLGINMELTLLYRYFLGETSPGNASSFPGLSYSGVKRGNTEGRTVRSHSRKHNGHNGPFQLQHRLLRPNSRGLWIETEDLHDGRFHRGLPGRERRRPRREARLRLQRRQLRKAYKTPLRRGAAFRGGRTLSPGERGGCGDELPLKLY